VLAMLASLCATLALLVLGGASALASTPSFTQAIDSPNSLNADSCVPQSTDCVVSDSKGNALYSTNVSTSGTSTWTAWNGPAGASSSEAVACPTSSLCAFADGKAEKGGGGNMYYSTSFGGSWEEAVDPVWGIDAVSCPTSSFCLAGEAEGFIHYSTDPASSEWKTVSITSSRINAVDCLSAGFCAVADDTGHVRVAETEAEIKEEKGWKSTDIDGSAALHSVACTSDRSCFAVDGEGNVLNLAINGSGEATVSKDDIDGTNDLTAIACTEGFVCAVVDSTGNVFTSGDGGTAWNAQLALGSDLTSVSCASSALCVAADTAGSVTVFAPPHFALSVFVTGQGEVESTPAGIKCSSEECSYALEGEVTLTAAKAGAGYEFAGWLGCKKVSAESCRVDVTAATEVTAVFVRAGREGAAGKEGVAGREGPTGNEGKTGVAGSTGGSGATGAAGARGATGAQGPAGPAGKVELVTCTTVRRKQHCTAKLVSGTVKFSTAGPVKRATLSRHGVVYAAGTARRTDGRMSLRLVAVRRLLPDRYTLTLITGSGRHRRRTIESFTIELMGRRRDADSSPLHLGPQRDRRQQSVYDHLWRIPRHRWFLSSRNW
jgi:Collagen triple helix repeat (20 copies)